MSTTDKSLPDWWQREKQRRQTHLLVLLLLLISLIAFFYYISKAGVTGITGSIDFDTSNTIAFIRQDSAGHTALCDIRADGTGLKVLTPPDDVSDKSAPAWSLDGKQLYYASNRDDRKKMQIYICGAGDIKQLTHGAVRKEAPFPTPDGKRIAYLAAGAVRSILPNGNDTDQILPPPRVEGNSGAENGGAAFELNGPYLSASFATDGSFTPDGSGSAGIKELSTENVFNDPQLRGLAGGDQVAEVVPPGTTKAIPLDMGSAVGAVWEPGGSRLLVAYAESPRIVDSNKNRDIVSGLTLYSFDKTGKPNGMPLLLNIGQGNQPRNLAWSPDGKRIAFEVWVLTAGKVRQPAGILIMNLPDKLLRFRPEDMMPYHATLFAPTSDGQPHLPRWSPDGARLLYQMTRQDGKNDLWVVNSDLTNPINLTKGSGDNTQGAWSPALPK